MIAVTLDEAHATLVQRHLDAATASAHVAGGIFDFLLAVIFNGEACVHRFQAKKRIPRHFSPRSNPDLRVNPALMTVN
jgi:hypothetical protein